jgi:hypothetical protein
MSDTDHVRRCLAGLDDAISQADARGDAVDVALNAHLQPLQARIEIFEDIGSTIAEQRSVEIAGLTAKIADAKDDAAEKTRLVALQKVAQEEVALLERIAVRPSLDRRCADDPDIPRRLLEWKNPIRAAQCIVAVSNRIDQVKTANPEPRDRAADRTLGRLYAQLDRVELAGRQIAAAGGTVAADAAPTKPEAKNAAATPKADPGVDTSQSSADLAALTALATEPIERRACVGDPNRHLKIEGGAMIARCIDALSAAIENMQFNRDQQPMDEQERNQKLSELSLQLARFQEAGRRVLKLKSSQMASMQAQHDATQDDDTRQKIDAKEKSVQAEITVLEKSVITQGADPVTEFADYEQWFNKLSMGYEYAGATDAFSKGFPRIGAMIGFHYPRQLVPDAASSFHFGGYGVYNMFTIWLTNSGEATPTPLAKTFISTASRAAAIRALDTSGDPDTGTTDSTPKQPTLTRAVEFEYQIFWPWWRNDFQAVNPRLRTTVGPLIVLGARKLDSDTFAHDRVYVGLRNARSPDTFYDFLYGRTGGLISHRIELRGQYALPLTFKNNARLALGGVGNFGINKRRHGDCSEAAPNCRPDENDSIRFYLSYDIGGSDFLKFFGGSDTTK